VSTLASYRTLKKYKTLTTKGSGDWTKAVDVGEELKLDMREKNGASSLVLKALLWRHPQIVVPGD
jgi:hypothetical protein